MTVVPVWAVCSFSSSLSRRGGLLVAADPFGISPLLGHATHADTDVDHVEEPRAANQASFPRAALYLVSRAARHDAM